MILPILTPEERKKFRNKIRLWKKLHPNAKHRGAACVEYCSHICNYGKDMDNAYMREAGYDINGQCYGWLAKTK